MSVQFKRIERGCEHNRKLREQGKTRGIIYDPAYVTIAITRHTSQMPVIERASLSSLFDF